MTSFSLILSTVFVKYLKHCRFVILYCLLYNLPDNTVSIVEGFFRKLLFIY